MAGELQRYVTPVGHNVGGPKTPNADRKIHTGNPRKPNRGSAAAEFGRAAKGNYKATRVRDGKTLIHPETGQRVRVTPAARPGLKTAFATHASSQMRSSPKPGAFKAGLKAGAAAGHAGTAGAIAGKTAGALAVPAIGGALVAADIHNARKRQQAQKQRAAARAAQRREASASVNKSAFGIEHEVAKGLNPLKGVNDATKLFNGVNSSAHRSYMQGVKVDAMKSEANLGATAANHRKYSPGEPRHAVQARRSKLTPAVAAAAPAIATAVAEGPKVKRKILARQQAKAGPDGS